jgi:hypothetical protein
MSALVFVGPSLRRADREAACGFEWAPPAAQGDVFRAVRRGAAAVGIIDGYFDGVPAVWHKEILWAMSEGVHVFGAASMGALRAAELECFGMRGIGEIFETYRDGWLTADDEVAVLHGPAEAGYPSVTEPMVNIRSSLARARTEGIIEEETRHAIEDLAKAQFYQERTWETVLAAADRSASLKRSVERLRGWLPAGRIDQKRADALAMLSAMRELIASNPRPMQVHYRFECTELWAAAPWRAEEPASCDVQGELILDELRLDGAYRALRDRALLFALAEEQSERIGSIPERGAVRAAENAFRLRQALLRREELDRWCAAAGTDPKGFQRMMAAEASVTLLARERSAALAGRVLDQLRVTGDYARLAERARCKARALEKRQPVVEPPASLLYEWYFHGRRNEDVPNDLAAFSRDLGLEGTEALRELLLREYRYAMMAEDGGTG